MTKTGHFDTIATRYDAATRLLMLGTHDKVRSRIVDSVEPVDRALDICCGTGYLTGHIRANSVAGLDLSTGMLSVNNEKNGRKENVSLFRGNAFQLPFADDSFDAVFCSLASHEFKRFGGILAEASRVAKSGAEIAIYDVYSSPHVIDKPLVIFLRHAIEGGQFYIKSEEEWRELLEGAGFENIRLREMYMISALIRGRKR